MNLNKKIIDVGIITFNHENFIEQCIESVYEQTISDNMRVIVIDDASTDNTSGILKQLNKKYPFHLIQHDNNKGIIQSAYAYASLLESPFFCWLDGDDYWKYKDKLKVQIEFLENNPQYSACFHDSIIQQENATGDKNLNRTQFTFNLYSQFNHYKKEILPQDIINRTILPTSSVVYRKKNIPGSFWDLQTLPYSLSWKFQLEHIKNSKFYYFNHPWSVYRDHPGGFSKETSLKTFKFHHIEYLLQLLKDNDFKKYKYDIYKSIAHEYEQILLASEHEHLNTEEWKHALKGLNRYEKLKLQEQLKELKRLR